MCLKRFLLLFLPSKMISFSGLYFITEQNYGSVAFDGLFQVINGKHRVRLKTIENMKEK